MLNTCGLTSRNNKEKMRCVEIILQEPETKQLSRRMGKKILEFVKRNRTVVYQEHQHQIIGIQEDMDNGFNSDLNDSNDGNKLRI